MADDKKKGVFYIGVDFGTFKTAIAATNGVRELTLSVVGYPKDPVSRKLLGKDIIFGEDVFKHRLALNVIRPFEKGALKFTSVDGMSKEQIESHKKAAKELLQHVVNLARPEKGNLIYGVLGVPAKASIHNKQNILEFCKGIFDSVMVVSEPFAVAYGLNQLEDVMVVDIGAGTVDFCRMHGALPSEEDQITLTTAGDYLDELFMNIVKERHKGVQITINMAREIKEKYSFVHNVADRVTVTLPVDGKPTVVDLTEDIKTACQKIIPPMVDAVRKLIAEFDPEFQRRIMNNILLAGGGSQLRGLDRLFEDALKEYGEARVRKVPEPVYAGANGALKLAMDMPEEYWNEIRK